MRTKKKSKKAGSLKRPIEDAIIANPNLSILDIMELLENFEQEQREEELEFSRNLRTPEAIQFFLNEDEDEDEKDIKKQRISGNKKRKTKRRRRGRK